MGTELGRGDRGGGGGVLVTYNRNSLARKVITVDITCGAGIHGGTSLSDWNQRIQDPYRFILRLTELPVHDAAAANVAKT